MTWIIRANDATGNGASFVQVGPQPTEAEAREMFAATHPHMSITTIGTPPEPAREAEEPQGE